jgi:hypothetical protein
MGFVYVEIGERNMLPQYTPFFVRVQRNLNRCALATLVGLTLLTVTSHAQAGFVSGSSGADGAFNPTTNVTVQLPESGVLNYTTVNIPSGVTVRFGKNSRNTPVTLLATGDVIIGGTINIAGGNGIQALGGTGGPGGFNGGNGGPFGTLVNGSYQNVPGANGDGPGGGSGGGTATADKPGTGGGGGFGNSGLPGGATSPSNVINGTGGPRYGLPTLLPLIGGSGGGGETGSSNAGGGGGGGGGALLIASSGTISFPAAGGERISASGGTGFNAMGVGSGGGSGGAVRLIANTISGDLRLNAVGGSPGFAGGQGGGGYVRIEGFDLTSLNIVLGFSSSLPRVSTTTPKAVTSPNLPTIRITSVAGITAPNQPNGTLQGGPDIILAANQSNPVTVALTASNIPLGTTLQLTLTPENGARVTTQSSALSGTLASSTATASISVPDGICVIQASGTIDVTSSAMMINGERVKTIEVTATFGGKPTVTYVTASNKRVRVEQ